MRRLAAVTFLILNMAGGYARAALIMVSTESDQFGTGSDCSLREAVQAANTDAAFGGCIAGSGGDVIGLPTHRLYYRLTGAGDEDANATGDLDIHSSIIVLGMAEPDGELSPEMIQIECTDRCFDVHAGGFLAITDLSMFGGDVTGASAPDGGLLRRTSSGVLRLVRVNLHHGAARYGGALYESGSGDTQLTNVSIHDNVASAAGGGLAHFGTSETLISNVTISGNRSTGSGGGLYVVGPTRLKNVTIARNTAGSFGGGMSYGGPDTTTINIANSVVADNWRSTIPDDVHCFGRIGNRAYSLIEHAQCSYSSLNGPSLSEDPQLSDLFDFGKGLPTHATLPQSALINAGNPSNANANTACTSADQRGVQRSAGSCDIGAFEHVVTYAVNTTGDVPDASLGNGVCLAENGLCSLRAALTEAAASGGASIIRVPPGTYYVAGSPSAIKLDPSAPASILLLGDVDAPGRVVIDGNQSGRVLELLGPASPLQSTRSFAAFGVTIQNGRVPASAWSEHEDSLGGGIKVRHANFYLYRALVQNNAIEDGSGGGLGISNRAVSGNVYNRDFAVQVEATTLRDNDALLGTHSQFVARGGGIAVSWLHEADVGQVRLINATLTGNFAETYGGAVASMSEGTRVIASSIIDNVAQRGGGGVYDVVQFGNSVLALNTLTSPGGKGPDCTGANVISLGYNLISSTSDCTRNGDLSTDLIDVNAGLSGLQFDPGPMPVYVPMPNSPLLDAIPHGRCIDYISGQVAASDQLGDDRFAAGSTDCSIGAVENGVQPPELFGNGFESP